MDTTENADIAHGAENSGPDAAPNAATSARTTAPPSPAPTAAATPADHAEGTRPARTAAFFDLDKTIIAKSSALAFSRPFYQGGLINRRTVLKSAYAQFVFLVGGADHDQMEKMRAYLSAMTRGGTSSRCARSSPRRCTG